MDNKKQDLLLAALLDHRHFKSGDKHIPEVDLAKPFACFSAGLGKKPKYQGLEIILSALKAWKCSGTP